MIKKNSSDASEYLSDKYLQVVVQIVYMFYNKTDLLTKFQLVTWNVDAR